jgi:hypothetical protein
VGESPRQPQDDPSPRNFPLTTSFGVFDARERTYDGLRNRPEQIERATTLVGPRPEAHRVRDFKLSKDLHFEEKLWDVVGLYLNPPDRALVLAAHVAGFVRREILVLRQFCSRP